MKVKNTPKGIIWITISLLLFFSFGIRAQESVDLIIWAGQSNAQGWQGDGAEYPMDEKELDSEILLNWTFFGNGSSEGEWVNMQPQKGRFPDGHFGPEVTFSREMKKEGYSPAIFKYTRGGTGLASVWKAPGEGGIYDNMVNDLISAIENLESRNLKVNIAGFVWIQGESDARNAQDAAAYQNNLWNLITHLRNEVLHQPDLKVILGLDEQHIHVQERPIVIHAQENIAHNDINIIRTSMYGLPKADKTHLTPTGLVEHGKQIFTAFQELNKNAPTFFQIPGDEALESPDGHISLKLQLTESGSSSFRVNFKNQKIIEKTKLGINLKEPGYDFTSNLTLINVLKRPINEEYRMLSGKRLQRHVVCNEYTHTYNNQEGNRLNIVFRIFNDAVAYRYQIDNMSITSVVGEVSGYKFSAIKNTWSIPYSSGDERFFRKLSPGKELEKSSLSFPVLIETESNVWALISESDVSNYPLSSGQFNNKNIEFVFSNDHIADNTVEPNFRSPWRVMIIGDQLSTLVESCVIDHLAPPTQMTDLSWIEPGVTSFPWWGNNLSNSYPDTLKKYIDLSAAMNWRFMEFDIPLIGSPGAAIEKWKEVDWIKDVVDYGLEKGVLCYGWDDLKNLNTPEKRNEIFSKYNEFGVRGIKVDFVNSYSQKARKLVEEVIQDAAKHQLMVSFHGAQSPRGFARTYPHVITFEAVRGSEYYLEINGGKGLPPNHNCILPFTRNILGSMDYTPVAFSSEIRTTTMAHELALSVIFESGWQGICDTPEAYLNSVAKDFLSKLHSTWDETRFLDGYPGEYCCIARRKGDLWYVAGINSGQERTVKLNLQLRDQKVKLYTDNSDDLNSLEAIEIQLNQAPEITMRKNGGFVFIAKI